MVRSLPLDSDTRPEMPRILAIAAAIALHAFAFLLLLVPMATPRVEVPLPDKDIQFEWKIPEVIPPPPLPPDPVPVVQPQQRTPQPQLPTVPQTVTPSAQPVIVDNGSIAADPVVSTTPPSIDPGLGAPLQGVQLEYAIATPPRYPTDAARTGAEGTVLLKILVDVDGRPIEVSVQQSSGNRSLDREARAHVLKVWRFKPAMRDGHPVQAYGLVPVAFSMQ